MLVLIASRSVVLAMRVYERVFVLRREVAKCHIMFGGVSNGGGGDGAVGKVTPGMRLMTFDEKTKPISREEYVEFLLGYEKNFRPVEKELFMRSLAVGVVSMGVGAYVGRRLIQRLSWKRMEERGLLPFPWLPLAGRIAGAIAGASFPYALVQQWTISQILDMDDRESLLAFHTKRLMIVQRGSMMFSREATREVTREEQQALAMEAANVRSGRDALDSPDAAPKRRPTDVNLMLGQQALTPVAQTGYKPFDK